MNQQSKSEYISSLYYIVLMQDNALIQDTYNHGYIGYKLFKSYVLVESWT